ncbi:hypothetical protein BRD00_12270 [Halobacteriales archaeon QS_8_69_26]|nr:MAG: hypothetical protein BRD00_12270 [Halobacteriales archaeon QS_8_69_26]
MTRNDAAKLGQVLAAGERSKGDEGSPGWCGLCDCDLDEGEGGIVAVEMGASEDGEPDAWLCRACYGYVVRKMGITPTRVFKAGRRRIVVLPIGPSDDHESVIHWE